MIDVNNFPVSIIARCITQPETLMNTLYEFELARTGDRSAATNNAVALFEDSRKELLTIAQQIADALNGQ